MIRLACFAVLSASLASSALALSCVPPDAARLYDMAQKDKAPFYIVRGDIQLLEPPAKIAPGEIGRTKARMTGKALSKSGFNANFDRELTIETSCLASWCGSAEGLTGPHIAALQLIGDALTLSIGPCGGDQVRWDQAGEDRLLLCHRAGGCEQVAK